jgi:hypothetical protein
MSAFELLSIFVQYQINMKTLLPFLLLLYSININAQHLYVSAGGGYNVPAVPQVIDLEGIENRLANHKGSFGKGYTAYLNAGYLLNEHIAAEIIFSQLKSTETWLEESTSKSDGKMLRIIPSVKLITGNKLKAYIRFGFVAGVNSSLYSRSDGLLSPTESLTTTMNYKGGKSFGFNSSVGAIYNLNKKIALSLELNTFMQNWGPDKADYESTGTGRLAVFSGSGTINYTDEIPLNRQTGLKKYYPFNSIGLQTGVVYYFCKKKISK